MQIIPKVTTGEVVLLFVLKLLDKLLYNFFTVFNKGMVFSYLFGVSRTGDEGAFRALSRGYTHWAFGCLNVVEINTCNPQYYHIRSNLRPSMKTGSVVTRSTCFLGKVRSMPL